jgi:hypothetical protein
MIKYLIPAVMMFVLVAIVQVLTPQPQVAAVPLITEVVQAEATGPGFFPAPKDDSKGCQCANCNCDELEKRVAALEAKIASYGQARPVASNGSAGQSGVAVSRPVTTSGLPYGSVVISERVVSSSPTVTYQSGPVLRQPNYQSGQPVRNVVRGVATGVRNTTCRIVNGVRVCN